MYSTKQFTIFFLLVSLFIAAISITAALAQRESTTKYDTSVLVDKVERISKQARNAIRHQEHAMRHWVKEVECELDQVIAANKILKLNAFLCINGSNCEMSKAFYIAQRKCEPKKAV